MTFAGFIIAVAVIGVLFYAWYYFVHRNGTNQAGTMNAQGGGKTPPTTTRPAFGSEIGTIGERDAQQAGGLQQALQQQNQPAPIRMRQQDGTLNNTNVEIGSIGDFKQELLAEYGLSPKLPGFNSPQVNQQSRQDAEQAFNTEVGTMGESGQAGQQQSGSQQQGKQAQAAQGSSFASSQVQQQLRADAQQAFGSEVGSIGESAQAGQLQQQQPSAQAQQQQGSSGFANSNVQQQMRQDAQQAFNAEVGSIGASNGQQQQQGQAQSQRQQNQAQGPVHQQGGAAMQKYTVEAGQIGEQLSIIDGQGNTLQPNFIPGTNGMGYFPPQVATEEVGSIGESQESQGQTQSKAKKKQGRQKQR